MIAGELIPLKEAARLLPPGRGGRPCHFSTVWRWITTGAKARDGTMVRLEAVRRPGIWLTSIEAIDLFFARLNQE